MTISTAEVRLVTIIASYDRKYLTNGVGRGAFIWSPLCHIGNIDYVCAVRGVGR
jgi:hypothetical protein